MSVKETLKENIIPTITQISRKGLRELLERLNYADVEDICNTHENIKEMCDNHPYIIKTIKKEYANYWAKQQGYSNLNEAFVQAVEEEKLLLVEGLLQNRNVKPNTEDNKPIILASSKGNRKIFDILIQYNVDPSAQNNEAIIQASQNGHYDIVDQLLDYPRVDPSAQNNEAIIQASQSGHTKIVKRLLQIKKVQKGLHNLSEEEIEVIGEILNARTENLSKEEMIEEILKKS